MSKLLDALIRRVQECTAAKDLEAGRTVHSWIAHGPFSRDRYLCNLLIYMYASCSHVGAARAVYNAMPRRNLYTHSIMLAAYTENGYVKQAADFFVIMPERGPVAWNVLCLAAGKAGDVVAAKTVFDMAPAATVRNVNAMLQAFTQNGHLEEAKEVFDRSPVLDVVSWSTMVAAFAESGHLEEALQTFNRMPQRNSIAHNTIVHALGECGLVEEAEQVFHSIPERTIISWNSITLLKGEQAFDRMPEWSTVSFANLICSMRDAGICCEAVRNKFDRLPMRDRLTSLIMLQMYAHEELPYDALDLFLSFPCRDLAAWQLILVAFAEVDSGIRQAARIFNLMPVHSASAAEQMVQSLIQSGRMEQGRKLFDEVPGRTSGVWSSLAIAYAQSGKLAAAEEVFKRMPMHTAAACGTMVAAYGEARLIELARRVVERIGEEDMLVSSIMITALARNGHLEEAKTLFMKGMRRRDAATWDSLMAAYGAAMDAHEARRIYDRMPAWSVLTWNCLLSAFARTGHFEEAGKIFVQMPCRNLITFTAMITCYSSAGECVQAIELLKVMNLEGFVPERVSFLNILQSCSQAGLLEEGIGCFGLMVADHSVVPSSEHYACVIDMLARTGCLDDAEQLLSAADIQYQQHQQQKQEELEQQPSKQLWRALLAGCKIHEDLPRASAVASKVLCIDPSCPSTYMLLANGLTS